MNNTSKWVTYKFEEEIRDILSTCIYTSNEDHHFGRPFMTAYQIAIQFKMRNPLAVDSMGLIIGGKDSGVQTSLSQYIARELSARIKREEIIDMEGGFLSHDNLVKLSFEYEGNQIESSLIRSEKDVSIFRLK